MTNAIEALNKALKTASDQYNNNDKVSVIMALGALFNFALPHIEDQKTLQPYNDLILALTRSTEGFDAPLLRPRKRTNQTRISFVEMSSKACAAAALDLYMKDMDEDSAAIKVATAMNEVPGFSMTANQIKELRRNINKGRYNKTVTSLFLGFVNNHTSADKLLRKT